MKIGRALAGSVLLIGLLLTTACFTIEQEVFLNPDGSGEMMVALSLPDLPSDKSGTQPGMTDQNPAEALDKFKKEIMAGLPPTVKIKEAKAVQQNGSLAWYAVFDFKDIKDMGLALTNLGASDKNKKPSPAEGESSPSEAFNGDLRCALDIQKAGDKHVYTGRLSFENPKAAEPKKAPTTEKTDAESASMDISKQVAPLIMGAIKLRFVLHTPTPITESNADVVLRGNTAIWNCTLLGFLKDKKEIDSSTRPIEMHATF